MMNRIDLFLLGLSLIYLSAFSSLLIQCRGLYSDNGILPARLILSKNPSLFMNYIFPNSSSHMEDLSLLIILGVILSSLAFIFESCRSKLIYLFLWLLYFSIYQIGQTFLWFQWDILLLESGILAVLMSRVWLCGVIQDDNEHHSSVLAFWLVKWLIFRLMFASGVVKLTSNCPTWWGLTALHWHYESQCIPTSLAWFAHQLPPSCQSLSVVGTYFIEIMIPILFFIPMRPLQWFCFYSQVFLQILIILTGNYNFFNLLTILLCTSLLPRPSKVIKSKTSNIKNQVLFFLEEIISTFIIAWLIYQMMHYFGVIVDFSNYIVKSKIKFTKTEFSLFLESFVPFTIYVGAASLISEIIRTFSIMLKIKGLINKVKHFVNSVWICALVIGIFSASLIPYTNFESKTHGRLPRSLRPLYESINRFEVVNSYGLFRSMTGVGGRPEIIIEFSENISGPWNELEFLYKPGNMSRPPPFIIPHQPRLDWQMWFAALGTYEQNPWLINLLYRILTGEKSVTQLLDINSFPKSPPHFVRVNLYHYHYTSLGDVARLGAWWKRDFIEEYLPAISLESEGLREYLRSNDLIHKKVDTTRSLGMIKDVVHVIVNNLDQSYGHLFVWIVILGNILLKTFLKIII